MTQPFLRSTITLRTGLVADPSGKHLKALRQTVWLYLFLLAAVSPSTGERLIDPTEVAGLMGISEGTVRAWLGQLRHKGYLACRRDRSHVWVRVIGWRENAPATAETVERPKTDEVLGQDRIPASWLAQKLGEPQESPLVAELVEIYGADAIRTALDEVLAVPEDRIKKSRLSFLVYLLKKSN